MQHVAIRLKNKDWQFNKHHKKFNKTFFDYLWNFSKFDEIPLQENFRFLIFKMFASTEPRILSAQNKRETKFFIKFPALTWTNFNNWILCILIRCPDCRPLSQNQHQYFMAMTVGRDEGFWPAVNNNKKQRQSKFSSATLVKCLRIHGA